MNLAPFGPPPAKHGGAGRLRANAEAIWAKAVFCFKSDIWPWFAGAPATKATQMSSTFAWYRPPGIFLQSLQHRMCVLCPWLSA
jgi:hypothetical protein